MKKISYDIRLGILMILLSITGYSLHYFLFRDSEYIYKFMLCDIAFVFIQVLLVTIIIHNLLDEREKRSRMEKLNMVIGVFFSETGTDLLRFLSELDQDIENIRQKLIIKDTLTDNELSKISVLLKKHPYRLSLTGNDLEELRSHVSDKRDFLLLLMENPNLMEHERFTELLRAIFHMVEELKYRAQFSSLPESDIEHLVGDINRVYTMLVSEWISYMKHLKENFPYFFSLAMRTNPFDISASVIVK